MDNDTLIASFSKYLKKKDKTFSTISAYTKDIIQLSTILENKNLLETNEEEIRSVLKTWIYNGVYSTKTVSRKLNSIRTFYLYLIEKRLITLSPAENIRHPKFRSEKQKIIAKNEYGEVINRCNDNLKTLTMFIVLLQTGIRISELSRLKIKDLILTNNGSFLIISKFSSQNERKIVLNSSAEKALRLYFSTLGKRNENHPLFSTKTGKFIQIRNIRSALDRAMAKAKLKNYCVNDIRNTFIVHQLSNGYDIKKLAEYVGHKTSVTTSRYLELMKKQYKSKRVSEIPTDL